MSKLKTKYQRSAQIKKSHSMAFTSILTLGCLLPPPAVLGLSWNVAFSADIDGQTVNVSTIKEGAPASGGSYFKEASLNNITTVYRLDSVTVPAKRSNFSILSGFRNREYSFSQNQIKIDRDSQINYQTTQNQTSFVGFFSRSLSESKENTFTILWSNKDNLPAAIIVQTQGNDFTNPDSSITNNHFFINDSQLYNPISLGNVYVQQSAVDLILFENNELVISDTNFVQKPFTDPQDINIISTIAVPTFKNATAHGNNVALENVSIELYDRSIVPEAIFSINAANLGESFVSDPQTTRGRAISKTNNGSYKNITLNCHGTCTPAFLESSCVSAKNVSQENNETYVEGELKLGGSVQIRVTGATSYLGDRNGGEKPEISASGNRVYFLASNELPQGAELMVLGNSTVAFEDVSFASFQMNSVSIGAASCISQAYAVLNEYVGQDGEVFKLNRLVTTDNELKVEGRVKERAIAVLNGIDTQDGMISRNTVSLQGAKVGETNIDSELSPSVASVLAYGSSATDNTVKVIDSNVRGTTVGVVLLGGTGKAENNKVEIRNSSVGSVYGAISADGSSNQIRFDHSVASGDLIGLKRTGPGSEDENNSSHIVISTDSKIGANVIGTLLKDQSSSSGNLIEIDGEVSIGASVMGAAYGETDGSLVGIKLGNKGVFGGQITTGGLGGFENIIFNLREQNHIGGKDGPFDNSKYILNVTSSKDIDLIGSKIEVFDYDGLVSNQKDQAFGLIKLNKKEGTEPTIKFDGNIVLHETFKDLNFYAKNTADELYILNESLVAGKDEGVGEETEVLRPAITPNENSNSLTLNQLENLALIKQGAEFVAGEGLEGMVKEQLYGRYVWGASEVSANKYRYNKGTFKLNGGQIITGAMDRAGDTLIGGLFEAGWSHSYGSRSSLRTSSNLAYYGIGVLSYHPFNETFSLDGSLRFGLLRNHFKGSFRDFNDKANFTTHSPYFTAHLRGKVSKEFNDSVSGNLYLRYLFSFVGSDHVNLGDREKDKFRTSKSYAHTFTLGGRMNQVVSDKTNLKYGLAVSYTPYAKAKGKIDDLRLNDLTLKGVVGEGELGVQTKPSANSPWFFDAGVKGFVGVRRGVAGTLRATYTF